jgi:hypothetical protein
MNKAQWTLVLTLAASSYSVGTIWMVQIGYLLWPYVAPGDFKVYHEAWWFKLIPVVFPVAAVALFGALAMLWWRPEGVRSATLWVSVGSQLASYILTGLFWARWQAQVNFARLPDGSFDPIFEKIMSTHWLRVALLTLNGLAALWMMVEHLSLRSRALPH